MATAGSGPENIIKQGYLKRNISSSELMPSTSKQLATNILQVTYSYKLKLDAQRGEVYNSDCECPAGKGPHGTCKHLAAVLLMLQHFVETGYVQVAKTCTENLQQFHTPKQMYEGSPVKAEQLCPSARKKCKTDDPRPAMYRNMPGYTDHVHNTLFNFCSLTSKDIPMRYLIPQANIQSAAMDHDYLDLPFTEHWVMNGVSKLEPSRWYVFGVRNGRPYLEYFDREERIFTGQALHTYDMSSFLSLSYTLGRTNKNHTFCIFMTDQVLELTAPTRAHMVDWCQTMERSLHNLGYGGTGTKFDHHYSAFPVKRPSPQTSTGLDASVGASSNDSDVSGMNGMVFDPVNAGNYYEETGFGSVGETEEGSESKDYEIPGGDCSVGKQEDEVFASLYSVNRDQLTEHEKREGEESEVEVSKNGTDSKTAGASLVPESDTSEDDFVSQSFWLKHKREGSSRVTHEWVSFNNDVIKNTTGSKNALPALPKDDIDIPPRLPEHKLPDGVFSSIPSKDFFGPLTLPPPLKPEADGDRQSSSQASNEDYFRPAGEKDCSQEDASRPPPLPGRPVSRGNHYTPISADSTGSSHSFIEIAATGGANSADSGEYEALMPVRSQDGSKTVEVVMKGMMYETSWGVSSLRNSVNQDSGAVHDSCCSPDSSTTKIGSDKMVVSLPEARREREGSSHLPSAGDQSMNIEEETGQGNIYSDFPTKSSMKGPSQGDTDEVKVSMDANTMSVNHTSPILPKRTQFRDLSKSAQFASEQSVTVRDQKNKLSASTMEIPVNAVPPPTPPIESIPKLQRQSSSPGQLPCSTWDGESGNQTSSDLPLAPPRRKKNSRVNDEVSFNENDGKFVTVVSAGKSKGLPPRSVSLDEPSLPPRLAKTAVPPLPVRVPGLSRSVTNVEDYRKGARPKSAAVVSMRHQLSVSSADAVSVMKPKHKEVDDLRAEIDLTGGMVRTISKVHFQSGLALIECFNRLWIAGWDLKKYPRLHSKFHIGDELLMLNDVQVSDLTFATKLIKNVKAEFVEVTVKRLPNAKVFAIQRTAEGESLGIKRDGGSAEIVYVDPHGLASRCGLSNKTTNMSGDGVTNWVLTEINNRPLNLFFKDHEIEHRLKAVGKDISFVVQPSDFVKELKKQLKKIRSYKDFLVQ